MKSVVIKRIGLVVAVATIIAVSIAIYRSSTPTPVAPDPEWDSSLDALDVRREQFFVQSGRYSLEADLLIPNGGAAVKPAVIFSPGSSDSLYQNYAPGLLETYVHGVFLPRDTAVLYINKRGMGRSEGNWLQNDFQGRADDLYAAVQHLQDHPAIDAERIGLVGHSQGGWIVGLTAAQHEDVAFFISLAGPVTGVEDQMLDIYEGDFSCQGYEGEELARRASNQLKLTRLGASVGGVVQTGVIGFDSRIIDYDPREALETVRSPGLLVFGGNDILVPADQNMAQFEAIFDGDPPDNLTAVAIADANHRFRVVDSPCVSGEEANQMPQSDELVTVLNDWLTEQGF